MTTASNYTTSGGEWCVNSRDSENSTQTWPARESQTHGDYGKRTTKRLRYPANAWWVCLQNNLSPRGAEPARPLQCRYIRLARFAHDMDSLHFWLKEVIVAELDMANKGRAACENERVVRAIRQAQLLEYYLGLNLYDPTIDIGFVEYSRVPNVVERLTSCSITQTIGNKRLRWKTDKTTANLPTPTILCFGGAARL